VCRTYKPGKAALAGLAIVALFAASALPRPVAAGGFAPAYVAGNFLQSLQEAASLVVEGSLSLARDLRSLQAVYELHHAPEPVVAAATPAVEPMPRMLLCEVLTGPAKHLKKKSRI
jgi:hypothetical protein